MNTQFQTKKRYLLTMKILSLVVFSIMVFCITGQNAAGQVVVTYEDETVTIENYNKTPILLFTKDVIKENLLKTNSFVFTPKELDVEHCGFNLSGNFEVIKGKRVFYAIKDCPKKLVYYLFEGDSPMRIKASDRNEVAVDMVQKQTLVREEPESVSTYNSSQKETESVANHEVKNNVKTTPVKKTESLKDKLIVNPYTDAVNILIIQTSRILQTKELSNEEREKLIAIKADAAKTKKEIEKYLESLWEKKQDDKTKYEECVSLIKSSNDLCSSLDKLSSNILNAMKKVSDNVVDGWKTEYKNKVLGNTIEKDSETLLEIRKNIDARSQQPLLGWIKINEVKDRLAEVETNYQRIIEASNKFIALKKNEYDDANDRAVIENLVNEIPVIYKEITFYKDSLARIKTPYLVITLTGVVLLLLVIGIFFYIFAILRNKRIEKEKQIYRAANKTVLIEEEDVVEEVSYIVNISDIKEKAGIDYYEIKMSQIHDDTTIQTVYFSRKAIFEIYKFFSDFLKRSDKTNETGCWLVGRWDYAVSPYQQIYDICIESLVPPGDDAIYGEYILNFGAKIGITLNYAIENLCEKSGKEYVHTAWMHSHPGLGLFLSGQDLNVQSQLAHSQHNGRMLAIVLDSNTPDFKMAFFAPKKDGSMNNDKELKTTLSLETMYQWAKTAPEKAIIKPKVSQTKIDKQNYYDIPMLDENNMSHQVLFSGSVIIDMDMAVMPDKKGLRGYFIGETHDDEIFLNDFIEATEKFDELNLNQFETKPVACFFIETNLESLKQHAKLFTIFDLYIIYSFDDEIIYLFTKEQMKNFQFLNENKASISLMKMKEWTRRIR